MSQAVPEQAGQARREAVTAPQTPPEPPGEVAPEISGVAVRGTRAPVALSTVSVYPHTCSDAFGIAADLGYDGVEVMVWTDPVSQDVAALERLSDHYGVPVLAIHAPTLLVTQRVWGTAPWPKIERACEMATKLGARTVVAHPPFRWQREYAAGFVEGVARIADAHDVVLAVENMYPWRARQREMLAYLPGWDPVPQPYRHVTLDLSHSATSGVSGLDQAQLLGDRLAHLHLADGSGSGKDEHLVPGRGSQPCGEVLGLLAQNDFDGVVVVEVNTRKARTRAERETDLAESLAYARLHLAAAVGGTPADGGGGGTAAGGAPAAGGGGGTAAAGGAGLR